MSTQPATLTELGTYWTKQGGVNLGIVGNQKHCSGYHLGKDRIFSKCACRPDGTCEPGQLWADYSVKRPRDQAGLTNAASAIDLGKLDGTLAGLQDFSRWLVKQCQSGKCPDIREVIYSPDGRSVLRWESSDNLLHTGEGQGDLSHLGHTHISFYRDSEHRSKVPYFAPYFTLPDTSTEDTVTTITPVLPGVGLGTVSSNGKNVTIYTADGGVQQDVILAAFPADPYEVTITQTDGRAPHGQFRRLAAKPHAGYYVAAALVTYAGPSVGGDVKHKVAMTVDGAVVHEVAV